MLHESHQKAGLHIAIFLLVLNLSAAVTYGGISVRVFPVFTLTLLGPFDNFPPENLSCNRST